MKIIDIKTKKQENGVFGMPMDCYSIDGFIPIGDSIKYNTFLSCVNAIDERYETKFKIIFKDYGFFVELVYNKYNVNHKTFFMSYDNYVYFNDILYHFEDKEEKKIVLRKLKLIKLDEINV